MANYNFDLSKRMMELGFDPSDITPREEMALRMALQQLVDAVFAYIKDVAKDGLKSTRTDYLNALSQIKLGDEYTIYLDEKAEHLEEGYCVLYCGNGTAVQPKVLTSSGYKGVSEIKVGDYVLNHFGEFTKVLAVYDKDYLEDCKIYHSDGLLKKWLSGKKRWMYRGNFMCGRCGHVECNKTIDKKKKYIICSECLKKKQFVDVYLSGRTNSKIRVTYDHLFLTRNGWKKAQHLTIEDELCVPAFNECKLCKKPCRNHFCTRSHEATYKNLECVKKGIHPSQKETARQLWIDNSEKARKNSKLELAFERYISPYYPNYIRQYRVPIIKENGLKSVYRLDFYFPEHNVGIEMDGTHFHTDKQKDQKRDSYIKKQHNIDVIRITDVEWRKDYKNCIESVCRRMANHEGLYNFTFCKIKKIKHGIPKNGFNTTRQWDITVEHGSSFLCQGIIIHNSSFDMKPGLLHGPSAKIAEDGSMYNIVPIQGSAEYGSSPKETTFKVVSSKSPSTSFIHPGFAGIHAFDYAAQYIDEELTNIIYRILGE